MTATKVCVAAIDLQRLTIVRLLQATTKSWPIDLVGEGLRPGGIVRGCIGPIKAKLGFPHESEDTQLAGGFEVRDSISEAALYDCLVVRVDECVATIFDGNVHQNRYVIDGTTCRSLGSVLVRSSPMRVFGAADKWRLFFKDEAGQDYDLPVTDLNVICDPGAAVARLAAAKVGEQRLILRIGLARGFDGFGKFVPKRCYLQVNGIVFPS